MVRVGVHEARKDVPAVDGRHGRGDGPVGADARDDPVGDLHVLSRRPLARDDVHDDDVAQDEATGGRRRRDVWTARRAGHAVSAT